MLGMILGYNSIPLPGCWSYVNVILPLMIYVSGVNLSYALTFGKTFINNGNPDKIKQIL